MKDKLYTDKLDLSLELTRVAETIKQYSAELELLKTQDKILDRKIAIDLQDNLTNECTVDNAKFILCREVTATILKSDRQDAIQYNNKFKIGIFALTIQGMKLKAWLKEILSQNMSVPDFITYEEYPKIRIEKII